MPSSSGLAPSRSSSAFTWRQITSNSASHHAVGQIEVVRRIQRIENAALQMHTAGAAIFALQLFADALFQLVQRIQADLLGEFVVDRHFVRRL